ncbi:MAG: ShlB/FhaC/HecB family hemolysin secretion/activation protein [Phormidesmis sp.]
MTVLLGLLLFVWKSSGPVAAQAPPSQPPPSPTEPALPPIEPIEPETLPAPQPPPLEIDPDVAEPGAEEVVEESVAVESCLPLADSEEEPFAVTTIEVVGSTVLQAEIEQKVACYEGKQITLSDLFSLRSQITQLYIDNDYITSGAFIPNNQVVGDTLQVQVIEGRLETVQIEGLKRLQQGYVRSRINRAAGSPLNRQRLQDALQLLQLDPNISQVNAELTAGRRPGESLLILSLQETKPLSLLASSDNYRSPSIGSEGLNLSASYRNLFGRGEVISASYGLTEGLDLYDVGLSVPFNAADGTLSIRYDNSDSRIVEDAFADVGIRSDTETISVGIRQPIKRTTSEEFALGLDFDWRRSQSFILDDIPFSFSIGPEDGRSQVSALRFSQEWTKRNIRRVLAARSQFNVGLDILGATNNDSGTDGQFFSWIGQFQWVEQVSPRLLSLIKLNAQLTPDSLLPLERFSLGGLGTVRGYPQNQLVADNALNASAELRIPLTRNANTLQLAPFIDAGYGWNNKTPNASTTFLLGTGVGLRWQATPNIFLRTDYGLALTDVDNRGSSLQENGFYFSVTYQPN